MVVVCLFHLYPPVTRKRRWHCILYESVPASELSISEFSSCFFDFLPLNLQLVQSHQAWDIHPKAPYPRTQQYVRRDESVGVESQTTLSSSHGRCKNGALTIDHAADICSCYSLLDAQH